MADEPEAFGQYELLKKIGTGATTEVFQARVRDGGTPLAIKRILPEWREDQASIARMLNVGHGAMMLNHPNVASLFDLGKIDDRYFIAMEWVAGKDLATLSTRCDQIGMPLFIQHAVFIAIEICKGLEYAHRVKAAHGGISARKVLIGFEGEVKLTGFGMSRTPEQTDGRIDVAALGSLLREMTRQNPLVSRPFPRGLQEILARTAAMEPGDRTLSATELREQLTAFFDEAGFQFNASNLAAFMKALFAEELRQLAIG